MSEASSKGVEVLAGKKKRRRGTLEKTRLVENRNNRRVAGLRWVRGKNDQRWVGRARRKPYEGERRMTE